MESIVQSSVSEVMTLRQNQVSAQRRASAPQEPEQPRPEAAPAHRPEQIAETGNATGVRFAVNSEADATQIQIIDRETHEVIQSFPSEDMVRVMSRIEEVIGMLFDVRA